ncbi:MAG: bacteriophage holin [Candidatus Zixiibacteriota bacterium]
MKLNLLGLGFAAGIIWGLAVFLMTLVSISSGYADKALKGVASIYPGYSVSVSGSFIGLAYGFVDGFICALIFGLIYNAFVREKK